MRKANAYIRKIVVAAIGLPVFIVGLILIPLPGPGLIITAIGLFILAQEFDYAEKHFNSARERVQKVIQKSVDTYKKRVEEIDKM